MCSNLSSFFFWLLQHVDPSLTNPLRKFKFCPWQIRFSTEHILFWHVTKFWPHKCEKYACLYLQMTNGPKVTFTLVLAGTFVIVVISYRKSLCWLFWKEVVSDFVFLLTVFFCSTFVSGEKKSSCNHWTLTWMLKSLGFLTSLSTWD